MPSGLPPLTGWGRGLFLVGWGLLFFAAISAAMGVLPAMTRTIATPVTPTATFGLVPLDRSSTPTLGPTFGPALNAGIRRGDRLAEIDGKPVAFGTDEVDRQFAAAGDRPIVVVTLSASGKGARHVLRRDPGAADRTLAAVGLTPTVERLLLFVFSYGGETLPLIGCAILLMARRARDPLAPWASAMMLLMVLGNGQTGAWFQNWFADPVMANYIANGSAFGMLVVVLALFPNGRFVPRWSLPVALLGVLGVVATEPLPNSISNVILVASMLAAVAAVVARYRGMPPGAGRQQIRWALLGFAGSMGSLALLALVQGTLPMIGDYGAFSWVAIAGYLFGSGFEILLIVAMTVALLRYRLYDADATISRSVAYGLITLGLLAVFAGSEKLFEIGGERYFGEELGAVAGALGAAAAAVTIVPLHHRVTRWTERRFRSGLAELRHGLPLLVGDLRETAAPQALADAMLARVERGVRARHGAVVANGALIDARDVAPAAVADWLAANGPVDDGRDLHSHRADPLFPLRVPLSADGAGLVGWLLLGPRPDGSFYGREERAALREIADPVARALAIALARAHREEQRRAAEEGLRREVSDLRRTVDHLQRRFGTTTLTEGAA